jgi:hypothetical protein
VLDNLLFVMVTNMPLPSEEVKTKRSVKLFVFLSERNDERQMGHKMLAIYTPTYLFSTSCRK